jgi:hypothetical protein
LPYLKKIVKDQRNIIKEVYWPETGENPAGVGLCIKKFQDYYDQGNACTRRCPHCCCVTTTGGNVRKLPDINAPVPSRRIWNVLSRGLCGEVQDAISGSMLVRMKRIWETNESCLYAWCRQALGSECG